MRDFDWREHAACTGHPALFAKVIDRDRINVYPRPSERPTDTEAVAQAICWLWCPVREDCLQHAVDTSELYGVWGGLNSRQRLTLKESNHDRTSTS